MENFNNTELLKHYLQRNSNGQKNYMNIFSDTKDELRHVSGIAPNSAPELIYTL